MKQSVVTVLISVLFFSTLNAKMVQQCEVYIEKQTHTCCKVESADEHKRVTHDKECYCGLVLSLASPVTPTKVIQINQQLFAYLFFSDLHATASTPPLKEPPKTSV